MRRPILVSNRLPVTIGVDPATGEQVLNLSSGGLVTGLRPLHEGSGGLWVGYPGADPSEKIKRQLDERNLVPVDLDLQDYTDYYDGYANDAIWPLFHYFTEFVSFVPEQFEAYKRVNQRFADVIFDLAEPGDAVWVHDYHLMLLPRMLRDRGLDVHIGFFLHIPFPADETFRILPQRVEILRGLLGADLIGMHTYDYTYNYLRSVRRILGIESQSGSVRMRDHNVRVEAHPLGIDTQEFIEKAYSPGAERFLTQLKRNIGDRQVILGVDRLDYTKGLLLKLQAFERLLERSPRWAERVLFLQLAVPTRVGVETYQDLKNEVERRVSEINGIHGSPLLSPINYLYQTVTPEELCALYRVADVCFVSPVRDGLNLVAKEYVVCRDDGGGALVISEFAGAVSELGEALRVNPWDIEGTANQLERALEMSLGERNERMMPMRSRVIQNDVHRWVRDFMMSLEDTGAVSAGVPPMLTSTVLAESLAADFKTAGSSLVMLDYDGSLREFSERYEDATPTDEILDILNSYGHREDVNVFINSGRDHHTLGEWFGDCPIDLIAEHGAWMKTADEDTWQLLGVLDTSWKSDVAGLLDDYVGRTPGSRIEEKETALAWHYRQTEETLGNWQALELASLLENTLRGQPVEVMHGAKVIEIRQQGLTKARAYDLVINRFGPFDFEMATGDDRTDEDLFVHVDTTVHTVKIGSGSSAARVAVASPRSLREMLTALLRAKVGLN